jgi:hypothetical protein
MRGIVMRLVGLVLAGGAWAAEPATRQEAQERLAKAEAMFQARCKTAGEKIHRTADNVEGIFLMKVRPEGINYGDQFRMDDPYGRDLEGAGYIETFVRGAYDSMRPKVSRPGWPSRFGYRYVEALDPKDGKRYRYTGRMEEPWQTNKRYLQGYMRFVLDKVPAPGAMPRYGVTYDDISTREEREHWIAGSSLANRGHANRGHTQIANRGQTRLRLGNAAKSSG